MTATMIDAERPIQRERLVIDGRTFDLVTMHGERVTGYARELIEMLPYRGESRYMRVVIYDGGTRGERFDSHEAARARALEALEAWLGRAVVTQAA